jgi:hypothetical protein
LPFLALGADTVWLAAGEGGWSDTGNWSAGEPDLTWRARVDNGGMPVCGPGELCGGLILGSNTTGQGAIRLPDATASLYSTGILAVGNSGTGLLLQVDGTLIGGTFMRIGFNASGSGRYVMSNGFSLLSNELQIGYSGTGLFQQAGGYLLSSNGIRLAISGAGSRGRYELTGGTSVFYGAIAIGVAGEGEIIQSGGQFEVRTAGINNGRVFLNGTYELAGGTFVMTGYAFNVGSDAAKTGQLLVRGPTAFLNVLNGNVMYIGNGAIEGRLELSQGAIYADGGIVVGHATPGVWIQTGGTSSNKANTAIVLGNNAGGIGRWDFLAGTTTVGKTVWVDRDLRVGGSGKGEWRYGDANGCGTLREAAAGAGVSVAWQAGSEGEWRGWCDAGGDNRLNLTGRLTNNGRIIADGYGIARTLNLTNFTTFFNTLDNPLGGSNGWYAVGCGDLRLRPQTVTGNNTYYWGEQNNLDLVNAARLTFAGASGTLAGRLLATNHPAVPELGFIRAVSIHEFTVGSFTACDLDIRYDHTGAAALQIAESDLRLFRWNGNTWAALASACDPDVRTIRGAGLAELGLFAVGQYQPPRGTVLSFR